MNLLKINIKNNLLILDNANFHRSKIVKENIQNSNNKIIYSLSYNLACKPIENFFKSIKKSY